MVARVWMSDAACLFERQPGDTLATIGWGRGKGEGEFKDAGTRKLPVYSLANGWRGRFHGGMFPYVALAEGKSWQPGPYPGVELLILHKNDVTGGVTRAAKIPRRSDRSSPYPSRSQ